MNIAKFLRTAFFHRTPSVAASDMKERFTVTSGYFNVNFEVACEVEREVNYRCIRIIVELASVYINILQVIWLFNNLC